MSCLQQDRRRMYLVELVRTASTESDDVGWKDLDVLPAKSTLQTFDTCIHTDFRRRGIDCDYSQSDANMDHLREDGLLKTVPLTDRGRGADLVGASFLDHSFFEETGIHSVERGLALGEDIIASIGDPRFVTDQYFATVYSWMPFISKSRVNRELGTLDRDLPTDLAILVYCMKLLMWWPPDHDQFTRVSARTAAYATAKSTLSAAKDAGSLTLTMLQARLLLSLYEVGHSIFPAAYFSVGACGRHGILLGIDKLDLMSQACLVGEEARMEEQRRTWWAVLILDRYLNLGNPTRTLSTKDPEPHDLLPSKNEVWEAGLLDPRELFKVSSPTDTRMGTLARIAQATYLSSHVYRIMSEQQNGRLVLPYEIQQLDRTIWALINLSYTEGQIRRMAVCTQAAICFSALMILHGSGMRNSTEPYFYDAARILKTVAAESQWNANEFLVGSAGPLATISPLLLHWVYQGAYTYEILCQDPNSGLASSCGNFRLKLNTMSQRWLAAESYLHLLEHKTWSTSAKSAFPALSNPA